uniref:Transmembrane protein 53 n=2 Tax=Parascaris univalens TaxID=6257 RepID=A0A915BD05_PARUN
MGAEVAESCQCGDISVTFNENPEAALVLLFGWAGCSDRYLSKYSQIYEKAGFSTVRFTADIMKVRSFGSYRAFALELYENVLDSCRSSLIICHVFSMNGCSVFCALWDLIDTLAEADRIKAKIGGIIYDSCPANVNPWQGATAISIATLPPNKYASALRESYRVLLAGYFSMHRAMIWLRSQWEENVYEHNFAFYRMLAMPDLPANQLFLYSEADVICSAESINEFIQVQKQKGVNISRTVFTDSPHCQHFRFHPADYEQACLSFLNALS